MLTTAPKYTPHTHAHTLYPGEVYISRNSRFLNSQSDGTRVKSLLIFTFFKTTKITPGVRGSVNSPVKAADGKLHLEQASF